ncbi:unnamed protein product [Moneuplotes crassus]|uniref:Uncharacterized protein n=1 Tax=Euplotes crassus TaxID=5936 RepID=A0AAD1U5S3_EUPCR|nr:unnamed protein product [Moneuplotes crassus]
MQSSIYATLLHLSSFVRLLQETRPRCSVRPAIDVRTALNNEEIKEGISKSLLLIFLVDYRSNLVIMLPRLVIKYCD